MSDTAHTHDDHAAGDAHGHHDGPGHVVSMKVLITVFVALLIGTVLTVAATKLQLGEFNVWLALFIAFVKAMLVLLYFMHLRWDNLYNSIAMGIALATVVLFIGFALMDSKQYRPTIQADVDARLADDAANQ